MERRDLYNKIKELVPEFKGTLDDFNLSKIEGVLLAYGFHRTAIYDKYGTQAERNFHSEIMQKPGGEDFLLMTRKIGKNCYTFLYLPMKKKSTKILRGYLQLK